MTAVSWGALGAAGLFAAGDWMARWAEARRVEYVLKPATMVALLVVALTLEPTIPARRWAFVAALVLSLSGDVLLMLPRERFVAGLVAFLAAHLAYVAGLRIGAPGVADLVVPLAVVLPISAVLGRRILRTLLASRPRLVVPVSVYIAVISIMVVVALATREPLAGAGALLFFASDGILAWNRFVRPLPWAAVGVMATYHLGQAGLVLSLAR